MKNLPFGAKKRESTCYVLQMKTKLEATKMSFYRETLRMRWTRDFGNE